MAHKEQRPADERQRQGSRCDHYTCHLLHRRTSTECASKLWIPDTSESLDVAWVFGGIAQRDAQTIGSCIEPVVEINEDVRGPQPVLQLLASDHIAGTFDQSLQYLQRLSLQPELDAMLPQLARAHVELEDAESQDPARIARAVGG